MLIKASRVLKPDVTDQTGTTPERTAASSSRWILPHLCIVVPIRYSLSLFCCRAVILRSLTIHEGYRLASIIRLNMGLSSLSNPTLKSFLIQVGKLCRSEIHTVKKEYPTETILEYLNLVNHVSHCSVSFVR